jgi:hypothetical protein
MQTVLGTFDDRATAQRAVDQLIARGFNRTSVHMQAGAMSDDVVAPTSASTSERGMMGSVGHFFSKLFESDDKDHAGNYAEAVRRGSSVVAVDANDDAEVGTAQTVMQQLVTVNVDDRVEKWKGQGWSGFDPESKPLSGEELAEQGSPASVVQEELVVGKRTLDTGGLRVVKRVSETPVSGVVEEVTIGKDVTNRSEKVSDTVRRTDVDVERIPGTLSVADSDTTKRRS